MSNATDNVRDIEFSCHHLNTGVRVMGHAVAVYLQAIVTAKKRGLKSPMLS